MHIHPQHRRYFTLDGKPTVLLGGSDEDNPFQWPEDVLIPQLDALVACGGNFIRNTMSDRDPGNVPPFLGEAGRFQLSAWNDAYWQRLSFFLAETAKRGICVQITLWDQHDCTGESWTRHYWNPNNNNIGLAESGLHEPGAFYRAVRDRNALVLPYQMKFVRRVMEHCLAHDHVCYNICNEGWAGLEWECYWARFIRKVAAERGRRILVTTMEHGPDMSVEAVTANPGVFDYAELSQLNNASTGFAGREHYEHLMRLRAELLDAGRVMPMQFEKTYGRDDADRISFGDTAGAVRKFWQIIFAGGASARFHRPAGGLGLSEPARRQIQLGRQFTEMFDVVSSRPVPQAGSAEACLLRSDAGAWAVYFPVAESISVPAADPAGASRQVRWLSIDEAAEADEQSTTVDRAGSLLITPPRAGSWLAVIT